MQIYPAYSNVNVHVHEDERLQYGSTMSHPLYNNYDENYMGDPALSNVHFDLPQQKHFIHNYIPFQQLQAPTDALPTQFEMYTEHLSTWNPSVESYRNLRYNSPGGHFGGNMSESSSEHNTSPDFSRQQTALSANAYLPSIDEPQFGRQCWTTDDGLMLTPVATPVYPLTPSIAMKELEFQGNPEYQYDFQEDEVRAQIPMKAPEELELSDSIDTLPTSSHARMNSLPRSSCGSDSSASTPARDHDSDSDFDPRRKTSRSNGGSRPILGRAQRRPSSSSYTIIDINNRVHKHATPRPNPGKERTKPKALPLRSDTFNLSTKANTKAPRFFPCTFHAFGCPVTFANKNEWKRHIISQHLQLGFYRCDLGTCNPDNAAITHMRKQQGSGHGNRGRGHNKHRSVSSNNPSHLSHGSSSEESKTYNDFNRKDLFTQHCRRMHGPSRHLLDNTTQTNQAINTRFLAQGRKPTATSKSISTKDDEALFEEELESIRARCWTLRRHAPQRSSCGICGKSFEKLAHAAAGDGEGRAEERAWEERMEHLGRHYERDGFVAGLENVDQDLRTWGLAEGILVDYPCVTSGAWLVGYELPRSSQAVAAPDDDDSKREGLRKRGPRRRGDGVATMPARVESLIKKEQTQHDDSDEDAMAEDD